jgi:hypothetical protein
MKFDGDKRMPEEEKKNCFIIMPFSATKSHDKIYWDDHYKYLDSLLTEFPLKVHRSEALRGNIIGQIISDLVTSHLVVADLTDFNANVFWELGIRQSFRHCTITIIEESKDDIKLPFDLAAKATLSYRPSSPLKMQEFTSKFHDAIEDCLNNPNFPDSYVLETITGRGTLFQTLMKQESLRKLDSLISEINENKTLWELIKKTCETNISKREQKKTVPTLHVRFRTISIESLIVNRYLDAETDFYSAADMCYRVCILNNERLSAWDLAERSQNVERWLLNAYDESIKYFINFELRVLAMKKLLLLSA